MGTVASLLRVVGLVIVAILVVHILLTVFGANPNNAFATFMRDGANFFSLGLADLFTQPDPRISVALNYGIAAVLWLVITSIVVAIERRLG
jgi:hypothetical protein